MRCKICGSQSQPAFRGTILGKYDVAYFHCSHCEFLQTEEPYWLEESYSSAISDLDLGPVNRAIWGARIVEGVICSAFDANAKFVDWGGGYGVLTRLMRDRGYDFYWHDAHCPNLFAKAFVADESQSYALLSCFEVFEHFVEPRVEIEKMLKLSSNILFTTELPPNKITSQRDWWYLTPETGQHISIYSSRTLEHLAAQYGLRLMSNGSSLHLLTREPISERRFHAIARDGRIAWLIRKLGRRKLLRPSLLPDDFRTVTGWNVCLPD
ncbi:MULTISPECIES: class I SAM-dependent methyltransferase [Methylosinus]|uniref:Class I SAM-dependent methyltransferase n=1 Tax=Methylosinus trichosporium (strain ATCC 35070 / NCIMB 11131 / UNIQEM 75 / OB3b) TaxID=595536 RepID=A0A2D2D3J0_METT3|nr:MULTISPECIES: class I SAM-dependent methyltransferase [Methylosinus]ATQ69563.1 class I SAM-dependent methyltransferase [Methylosinus trichosporium OB3b]OBS50475.1 hypothetical protein A8B73_21175 [Methylosinus sp. 3S-1]